MFEIKGNNDYEEVYNSYVKNGGAKSLKSFEGMVPSGEGSGFNKGDLIEWPNEIKPLKVPIAGSTRTAQMIIVKVTGEDGAVRYQPFYPSCLSKFIYTVEVDSEGNYVKDSERLRPEGQAAKDYQACKMLGVDASFRKVVAKGNIRVTNYVEHDVLRYGTTEVTKARQYTFEYAN